MSDRHPMHMHGHNMYVLHEGPGAWDATTVVNASNPMRRDVQMVRANGHVVLQFDADNPGEFPHTCFAGAALSSLQSQLTTNSHLRCLGLPLPRCLARFRWLLFAVHRAA